MNKEQLEKVEKFIEQYPSEQRANLKYIINVLGNETIGRYCARLEEEKGNFEIKLADLQKEFGDCKSSETLSQQDKKSTLGEWDKQISVIDTNLKKLQKEKQHFEFAKTLSPQEKIEIEQLAKSLVNIA